MSKKKSSYYALSLKDFLIKYYGIDCRMVDKLTHKELKEIIPDIKRYPMDLVDKNKNLIYQGEVIMVKDKNNYTLAYVNPRRNGLIFDEIKLLEIEYKEEPEESINLDFLEELSLYELRECLIEAKKSHKEKEYRKIKKEFDIKNGMQKGTKKTKLERVLKKEKYDY